jgi:hypothetical protein
LSRVFCKKIHFFVFLFFQRGGVFVKSTKNALFAAIPFPFAPKSAKKHPPQMMRPAVGVVKIYN